MWTYYIVIHGNHWAVPNDHLPTIVSWSNFYQIHSNLIKKTPFGSKLTTHPNPTPVQAWIHFPPPKNVRCVDGGIILSISSLFTSFWDTIQFHRHLITPYLHWDVPRLVKGFQTHSSFVEWLLNEPMGIDWPGNPTWCDFYSHTILEVFQFLIKPCWHWKWL